MNGFLRLLMPYGVLLFMFYPATQKAVLISFVLYVSIECVAFLWVAIPYSQLIKVQVQVSGVPPI